MAVECRRAAAGAVCTIGIGAADVGREEAVPENGVRLIDMDCGAERGATPAVDVMRAPAAAAEGTAGVDGAAPAGVLTTCTSVADAGAACDLADERAGVGCRCTVCICTDVLGAARAACCQILVAAEL